MKTNSVIKMYIWLLLDWIKTVWFYLPKTILILREACVCGYHWHKEWLQDQILIRKERSQKRNKT